MGTRFILKKIVFEANSWRKLSGIEIPVSPRLTVIAGHNGIGKSSILGFIANTSGLSSCDDNNVKNYFGTEFISKFEQQFRLAPADVTAGVKGKGRIYLEYEADGEYVIKACNIGQTTTTNGNIRYRVVPRTIKDDDGVAVRLGVKDDGKIPMPTIFVSAARIWPIGESPKVDVISSSLDPVDAEFIRKFHNHIIPGEVTSNDSRELDLSLSRGRVIRSQHPTYKYDTTTISLGQGAIASIATALASFKRLKRHLKRDYSGGVLVVDEIEAGLHPRAQIKLVEQLLTVGKELNLQIVVTTHSLIFLEAVYKHTEGREAIDGIVYIMDTKSPSVRHLTLQEMYDEMMLSKTAFTRLKRPLLTVYTEDKEALTLLRYIVGSKLSMIDEKSLGIRVKKAALEIGCNQLLKLAKNKNLPHFNKHSVFVLDGDVKSDALDELENCIKLPTEAGNLLSPEKEIHYFLSKAKKDPDGNEIERTLLSNRGISWDWINEILDKADSYLSRVSKKKEKERDALKKWFRGLSADKKKNVIGAWIEAHKDDIKGFGKKYQQALVNVKSKLV
ncbi:AAA family ATPase [Sutterella wadsworthensis]|uniref:AAA family ATPase n=1 Tax=Sutterella wadsworthensis TaxID=40545 RepID=UPI001EB84DCB|nr:AAA family ATPase [Sutterella wadsworthensis]MBD8911203.1 ATP-binding protein [Sutterella wadsworthensis]